MTEDIEKEIEELTNRLKNLDEDTTGKNMEIEHALMREIAILERWLADKKELEERIEGWKELHDARGKRIAELEAKIKKLKGVDMEAVK